MLTNKELKDINKIIADLTLLEVYADRIEFPIGITIKDIQNDRKILNTIHAKTKIQKYEASKHNIEYKKIHKKRRNLVQNINNAKKRNDIKKYNYWTQKLNEYDNKKEVE